MTPLTLIDLADGGHKESEDAAAFLRKIYHRVPTTHVYALSAPHLLILTDSATHIEDVTARISEDADGAAARPLALTESPTPASATTPEMAELDETHEDVAPEGDLDAGDVSEDPAPTGEIPAIHPDLPFDALNSRATPGDSPLRDYLNQPTRSGRGSGIDRPQDILPWLFSRVKGTHAPR